MSWVAEVARNQSEWEASWAIVHDAYVDEGLIAKTPDGMFCHPEGTPDNAVMAIIKEDSKIVATTGGIRDKRGLPLDLEFSNELDSLRHRFTLFEAGTITVANDYKITKEKGIAMIGLIIWAAIYSGATFLLTSCHPHHQGYYERLYGIYQIGRERKYKKFNDAPVVMLGCDLDWMKTNGSKGMNIVMKNMPTPSFYLQD